MNINITLINEFCSFILFFYFSCCYIFPKLINIINYFYLTYFKNKSFVKFNQTIEEQKIKNTIFTEKKIKNNISFYLNNINEFFFFKKNNLENFFFFEKNNLLNNIKILSKFKKLIIIKNFLCELRIYFIKSFKTIYNELISYNNEYIINYD